MTAVIPEVSAGQAGDGLLLRVGVIADGSTARRITNILERSGAVVVASVADAEQLAAACLDSPPHVVVLPWTAAVTDGTSAIRLLASAMPRTRIVIVLREYDRAHLRRAIRAGVDGAVLACDLALVLPVVVTAVALGQASMPRDMRSELDGQAPSSREREVLALVAEGLSNAHIASRLCLSESTVKSHLQSAFSKLGVHTREEAVALASDFRRGAGFGETSRGGPIAPFTNGGMT